jgi:hypothetical protein
MMEPTAPPFPNCPAFLNKRFEKVRGFEFEQPHYSILDKQFLVQPAQLPSRHMDIQHNKVSPTMDPTKDRKLDLRKMLLHSPK